MKKLLLLATLILTFTISAMGQTDIFTSGIFTATGAGKAIPLSNKGIYNHTLIWSGAGTRTTCTVKLEQSVDGTVWTDLIAAQACTTNGTATTTGYVNYVRVNITALTGAGNTLYLAYRGQSAAAALGAVTVDTTGLATSAKQDTTNTKLNGGLPAALGTGGGLKVDGSGTALPISAAALPLPSGAATSALQGGGLPAALGAGGGIKVDGSGTPLPVSGTFWQATQPVSGTFYQTIQPVAPWANGTLASGVTAAITDTTSTQVIAGTALNYIYLGSCMAVNSHASVGTLVNFQDGSGGTTLFTLAAASGFGGHQTQWIVPRKVPTVGNGVFCAPVTTGASIVCSCSGFKSAVSY